eukprot:COSAG01_NODE_24208_length_786_cov_3.602620_2_plen_25_part_01
MASSAAVQPQAGPPLTHGPTHTAPP